MHMTCLNPQCGKSIPRVFSIEAEIVVGPPASVQLGDQAHLWCDECNTWMICRFKRDSDVPATITWLSVPTSCPTCGEALEKLDCLIDVDLSGSHVDNPLMALCPHCHDDITEAVQFAAIDIPGGCKFEAPDHICAVCGRGFNDGDGDDALCNDCQAVDIDEDAEEMAGDGDLDLE